MRLFRSKDVTGPYLDAAGNNAADNRRSGDEDGTISGAVEGTWEKKDSEMGYDYAIIVIGDVTYRGFFFRQHKEDNQAQEVMTFSALGDDNTCIWGSMAAEGDTQMLAGMAEASLKKIILEVTKNFGTLPSEVMGCEVSWSSSDEHVITADGQVIAPAEKTKVELTATITNGETVIEHTYHVTVKPE